MKKSFYSDAVIALAGVLILGTGTWAQDTSRTGPTEEEPTSSEEISKSEPSEQQAGKMPGSPREVCQQLLQAAKKDDFEAAMKYSKVPPTGKQRAGKVGEGKTRENMSTLKNLTCSNQVIAGDRAIVVAKSDEEKRLVPFVLDEGNWKFDLSTYQSFYQQG